MKIKTGEKRKHPRVQKVLFVALKDFSHESELIQENIGRTIDISEGGVLLEAEKILPFLSTVDLTIRLEDYLLKVEGEVTHIHKNWTGKVEMGVKFTKMSDEGIAKLKEYL